METKIIIKDVGANEEGIERPQNLVSHPEALPDGESGLITIGIKTSTDEKEYGDFMYFPIAQLQALIEELQKYESN